jgi:actin-related protein 5
MRDPYIDRLNVIARYKEKKVGAQTILFGGDCEADSVSRTNTRAMFDGDLLINGDVMVSRPVLPTKRRPARPITGLR